MGPAEAGPQGSHFVAQGLDEALPFRFRPASHLGVAMTKLGLHPGHVPAQVPDEMQAFPPQGHNLTA
jgi:hypothetical protein